jgi:hypothetical protein
VPSKPIEQPPEVAKAFVRDMRAFFAAGGRASIDRKCEAAPVGNFYLLHHQWN